jgi:hypothetical protein
MKDILVSDIAGRIPTVNQLMTTSWGLGWNRVDGLFYGLKIVGGVKTVVVIGGSTSQTHDRLHDMISGADHAASDPADYDKYAHSNAITGEVEWEAITFPDQYWQRISGVISPLVSGDDIQGHVVIAVSNFLASSGGDENGQLSTNTLLIVCKTNTPSIKTCKFGDLVSRIVQGSDVLQQLEAYGYDGSEFFNALKIIVRAGAQNWSSQEHSVSYDIQTAENKNKTLKSRIYVDENGNVVVNEDGESTYFRVEGGNEEALFIVEGFNNRVGIGTNGNPNAKPKTPKEPKY